MAISPASWLIGGNDVLLEPGFTAVQRSVEPYFFVPCPGHIAFAVGPERRYSALGGAVAVYAIAFKLADSKDFAPGGAAVCTLRKQDTAAVAEQIFTAIAVEFCPGTQQASGFWVGYQPVFILVFWVAEACETTVVVGFSAVRTFLNDDSIQQRRTVPAFFIRVAQVGEIEITRPVGQYDWITINAERGLELIILPGLAPIRTPVIPIQDGAGGDLFWIGRINTDAWFARAVRPFFVAAVYLYIDKIIFRHRFFLCGGAGRKDGADGQPEGDFPK